MKLTACFPVKVRSRRALCISIASSPSVRRWVQFMNSVQWQSEKKQPQWCLASGVGFLACVTAWALLCVFLRCPFALGDLTDSEPLKTTSNTTATRARGLWTSWRRPGHPRWGHAGSCATLVSSHSTSRSSSASCFSQ